VSQRTLLLINPNTSDQVTATLQGVVGATLGNDWQVVAQRAPFGAPYIACETSYAVGAHAALAVYRSHIEAGLRPDAVLVACFGDPGVAALQTLAPVPVYGLAEASMRHVNDLGRFAVVTGGAAWEPMIWRLARGLGTMPELVAVQTVSLSGADIMQQPQRATALLAGAVEQAQQAGASQVLLGGAGLAGMAPALQAQAGLPVHDSVAVSAQVIAAQPVTQEGAQPPIEQWLQPLQSLRWWTEEAWTTT